MSPKATNIVAYLTPIGLIVDFVMGTRRESRFHLNQALVLWLAGIVVNLVVGCCRLIPLVGLLISAAGGFADLVLSRVGLVGLVSAVLGAEWNVPVLGDIPLYS